MHAIPRNLTPRALERVEWEAELNPFGTPDPGFFEASLPRPASGFRSLDTTRGLTRRPRACLSLADSVLLQAALESCRSGLESWLTRADRGLLPGEGRAWLRSPFSRQPLDQAALDHARGRRALHQRLLSRHGYWLRADVTNFSASLDRSQLLGRLRACGLDPELERALRDLLERLGLGPRRGLRSMGRALHLLARIYLDPVIRGLLRRGQPFVHCDLDDFHFYLDTPDQAGPILDGLARLLEPLGLHLNYQKTFVISAGRARAQELRARLDPRFVRHRLAAAAAFSTVPWVVKTLAEPLYSTEFLHRRPSYARLLRTPAGQLALLQRLRDPHLRAGDRERLRLYAHWTGTPLTGPVREALER